jgi:DnaK suppressor protein
MDNKVIEELKAQLLKEKEDLEKSLSRIARPLDLKEGDYETNFEELGTDKDDNATEVDQYVGNASVEASLERNLQEVLEALNRIEKGTYGICENCKKEINLERLRVNPSARTCMKCD